MFTLGQGAVRGPAALGLHHEASMTGWGIEAAVCPCYTYTVSVATNAAWR